METACMQTRQRSEIAGWEACTFKSVALTGLEETCLILGSVHWSHSSSCCHQHVKASTEEALPRLAMNICRLVHLQQQNKNKPVIVDLTVYLEHRNCDLFLVKWSSTSNSLPFHPPPLAQHWFSCGSIEWLSSLQLKETNRIISCRLLNIRRRKVRLRTELYHEWGKAADWVFTHSWGLFPANSLTHKLTINPLVACCLHGPH